ncbi:MAG: hypothetical protein H0W99_01690 [Acidobacteria bacterium]|nr:hypothetical protein [Acidobacteriota bacterium]
MVKGLHLIQRCAVVMFFSIIAVILLSAMSPAGAQDDAQRAAGKQKGGQRLGVRLRSFIPTASGQMHFEPTPEGGIVILTVQGLPLPQVVMSTAHTFVVWASASGGRVVRVGELQTDASSNGSLQFTRPAGLDSYSVLVTVEPTATVEKLTGTVVFASLANEVTAFFAEVDEKVSRTRSAARELYKRLRLQRPTDDFFAEIDRALKTAPGGGRRIEMFGSDLALGAHASARTATLSRTAYVRARFQNLPPPILVNANDYVLWSVVPDGRITYMGSLPTGELDDTDVYVRVRGFNSDFDLFVTAEQGRPVSRPSDRRVLSSRAPTRLLQ